MFAVRFSLHMGKLFLDVWSAPAPKVMMSEVFERFDHFTYLRSFISLVGLEPEKILARIQKAQSAFASLRHLWRGRDIQLTTKGQVYCVAFRRLLLYGCEERYLKVWEMCRLQRFDHSHHSIASISLDDHVSNVQVFHRVNKFRKLVDEFVNLRRLKLLGHVLRMRNHRLPW